MKLGLSSYTYGWAVGVRGSEPSRPLDEHGLLDRVREHGLALLQIGDNLPLHIFDEGAWSVSPSAPLRRAWSWKSGRAG